LRDSLTAHPAGPREPPFLPSSGEGEDPGGTPAGRPGWETGIVTRGTEPWDMKGAGGGGAVRAVNQINIS
jgi:hypothetical protein